MTRLPRLIVAVMTLFALVLGPARAFAVAGAHAGPAAPSGLVICHAAPAGGADQVPEKAPADTHDCQLCPACQAAAFPALLPASMAVAQPAALPRHGSASRPPSTTPPRLVRVATPPTGPPALSV